MIILKSILTPVEAQHLLQSHQIEDSVITKLGFVNVNHRNLGITYHNHVLADLFLQRIKDLLPTRKKEDGSALRGIYKGLTYYKFFPISDNVFKPRHPDTLWISLNHSVFEGHSLEPGDALLFHNRKSIKLTEKENHFCVAQLVY